MRPLMFNNGQRVRYSLSTRLIRHLLTMPGLLMFSLLMVSLLIGGIGIADTAQESTPAVSTERLN